LEGREKVWEKKIDRKEKNGEQRTPLYHFKKELGKAHGYP